MQLLCIQLCSTWNTRAHDSRANGGRAACGGTAGGWRWLGCARAPKGRGVCLDDDTRQPWRLHCLGWARRLKAGAHYLGWVDASPTGSAPPGRAAVFFFIPHGQNKREYTYVIYSLSLVDSSTFRLLKTSLNL